MRSTPHLATACAALACAIAVACAGSTPVTSAAPSAEERDTFDALEAVSVAEAMIGAPYRYGGGSPAGFDCSGLVVYSYARAGLPGLPHSARALERRAREVALDALEPGDLLFFDLDGRKAHVGIFVGERSFVHAPSPGRRVERVSFDHVYWSPRLGRAGRLVP